MQMPKWTCIADTEQMVLVNMFIHLFHKLPVSAYDGQVLCGAAE